MIDVIRIVDVIYVLMLLVLVIRQRRIMKRLELLEGCYGGDMLENNRETTPPDVIENVH